MATRPPAAKHGGRCTPKAPQVQRLRAGVAMRWCATEAGLPAARQDARDELDAAMGEHHGGRVTWVEATGLYALRALDSAAEADAGHGSQELRDLRDRYRRLRAQLLDRGGWLVIATAPGSLL